MATPCADAHELRAWWHAAAYDTSGALQRFSESCLASPWMYALVVVFGVLYVTDTAVAAIAILNVRPLEDAPGASEGGAPRVASDAPASGAARVASEAQATEGVGAHNHSGSSVQPRRTLAFKMDALSGQLGGGTKAGVGHVQLIDSACERWSGRRDGSYGGGCELSRSYGVGVNVGMRAPTGGVH